MGFDTKTTDKIVDSMGEFIVYLEKFLKLKQNLLKSDKSTKSTKSTKSIKSTKSTKSDKSIKSIESSECSESSESSSSESMKYDFSKFAGKKIVFTGFRDKEIEEELENVGAKITSTVSSNTNLVIAGDINDQSSKIVKAKELDIELISKEDFYKAIGK
jgi:NAD-dependent DNA ligase